MSLFRNNKPYLTARTSTGVTSYRNSFYLLAERAKSRNEALAAKLELLAASKLPAATKESV
jgi:hypothetical protein